MDDSDPTFVKTIPNECHTVGNIIRTELLKDDSVDFAAYNQIHPLHRKIEICIVCDNPEAAINSSIDSLQKTVRKLQKGWGRISE
jgi:DNA-directed RNA polymerase subunit L